MWIVIMIFEGISLLWLLGYLEDGEWKCESNDHYYLRLNFIDIKYWTTFIICFDIWKSKGCKCE